ncbi:MAG TPA: hypothetical protein QF683_16790, partial [SAR324 cluster bacterium]|nr:hypothetical protein [SAR324 cluster bacterium]
INLWKFLTSTNGLLGNQLSQFPVSPKHFFVRFLHRPKSEATEQYLFSMNNPGSIEFQYCPRIGQLSSLFIDVEEEFKLLIKCCLEN